MAKKKKEEDPVTLQITNKMIRYGGSVYPLRNISHVRTVVITPNYSNPVAPGCLVVALIMLSSGLYMCAEAPTPVDAPGAWGLIGMGALTVWWWWKKRKGPDDLYGVELHTNAGSQTLFSSPSERFIDNVVTRIVDVIEHGDRPTDITINIADEIIQDNSTTVHQTVYDLRVQHLNLAPADSEFLLNAFKPALDRLAADLEAAGAADGLESLGSIAAEINSPKPSSGVIKALWEKVAASCEGYQTIKTVGEVGAMVGKVALMFV